MKRIQLFEFEDQGWFPDVIRRMMLRVLVVMNRLMSVQHVVKDMIESRFNQAQSILDLGSGSGGIMPEVHRELRTSGQTVRTTLSDLHPDAHADQITQGIDGLSYSKKPVDATEPIEVDADLMTMINCFHHMPPQQAARILTTAQSEGRAILIYEMAEKKVPTLLWILTLPLGIVVTALMGMLLTFKVRPFSLSQFVLTWIVPIVPICYAWDGQASMARIYSEKDLGQLLESLPQAQGYQWEYVKASEVRAKAPGYFLVGRQS